MDPALIACIGTFGTVIIIRVLEYLLTPKPKVLGYDKRWDDPAYVQMIHETRKMEADLEQPLTPCECIRHNPPVPPSGPGAVIVFPEATTPGLSKQIQNTYKAAKAEYELYNAKSVELRPDGIMVWDAQQNHAILDSQRKRANDSIVKALDDHIYVRDVDGIKMTLDKRKVPEYAHAEIAYDWRREIDVAYFKWTDPDTGKSMGTTVMVAPKIEDEYYEIHSGNDEIIRFGTAPRIGTERGYK